jgi:hypothetical protein
MAVLWVTWLMDRAGVQVVSSWAHVLELCCSKLPLLYTGPSLRQPAARNAVLINLMTFRGRGRAPGRGRGGGRPKQKPAQPPMAIVSACLQHS